MHWNTVRVFLVGWSNQNRLTNMILLMILITENKRQVATVAYPAAPEQFLLMDIAICWCSRPARCTIDRSQCRSRQGHRHQEEDRDAMNRRPPESSGINWSSSPCTRTSIKTRNAVLEQQEQVREEANSHANGLPKNLIVYTRAGTQKDGVSEACSSDNLWVGELERCIRQRMVVAASPPSITPRMSIEPSERHNGLL